MLLNENKKGHIMLTQKEMNTIFIRTLFSSSIEIEDKQKTMLSLKQTGFNFNSIENKEYILGDLYFDSNKNIPLIKTIINNGLDAPLSLLHMSILKKDIDLSYYLLDKGLDPFFCFNDLDDNCLKTAICYGNTNVLLRISEIYPEKIKTLQDDDVHRIKIALSYVKDIEVYKLCLDLFGDINILTNLHLKNYYGNLLTHHLTNSDFNVELCNFLIDNYYKSSTENNGQRHNTLEIIFTEMQSFKWDLTPEKINTLKNFAIKLIDKGADPYIKNQDNESALFDYLGDKEFQSILISRYEQKNIQEMLNKEKPLLMEKRKRL